MLPPRQLRVPTAPILLLVALVVVPASADAQRAQLVETVFPAYRALAGLYGDEGPQLVRRIETMAAVASQWDLALGKTELQLADRLKGADVRAAVEAHAVLASAYAQRNRFQDALREVRECIRIDPNRAAFHRFLGFVYQVTGRPAAAADAFRTAWLLEPDDHWHAYRLVVYRSAQTTAGELERALATLARLEDDLIRSGRIPGNSPFVALNAIGDDIDGVMTFAPAAYARGFSLLFDGEFGPGTTALRAAAASDPLVVDPAQRSEHMARGVAELRRGQVALAITSLEAAVAHAPDSSEVHRVIATAYEVNGNVEQSLQHLRHAVRLNPRDERSWVALVERLDATGNAKEAVELLGQATIELPESGTLRWLLAVLSVRDQRVAAGVLEMIALAERVVVIRGRADLYARVAGLALRHFDYDRAVELLEQRARLTPAAAAAHRELGAAHAMQGHHDVAYAELVMALLLDPVDAGTLEAIGRLYLAAGTYPRATAALARAAELAPGNGPVVQALGDALVRAGRTSQGQKHLEEAARLQARTLEIQRRLRRASAFIREAELRMRDGQYDRAIELWQQAIELQGETAGIDLRLAEALAGANRLEQAAAVMEKAVALNAHPDAHRRLAEMYAELGRSEDSARERQTYVERRLQRLRVMTN